MALNGRSMPAPDQQARRARAAVAALFLTNGAVFFNVVPRYPESKAGLDVGNAVFGGAVAGMPIGALLAGLFAGAAVRRFSSARVAAFGVVAMAVVTPAIPFVSHWTAFWGVLFVLGALDAVMDVAQNAHGLRVQRLYRRSIVNSFHGVWSIGAVLGGLMGSAAAGLHLPLSVHLTISAVLISAVALVAYRFLLPGSDDAERAVVATPAPERPGVLSEASGDAPGRAGRRWRPAVRALIALGVLAACGALVEDAGESWGALFLSGDLGAGAATAGLAVVVFQAAMTVGRLTGDRVVDRFGNRTVARAGGLLAAAGMGGALAVPSVATALAGFALAGLGVATVVPAAMHAADELPGLPPGAGLTVVSWLLRGGFLISPLIVGAVADLAGLRMGLLSVVFAGVMTVLLARSLAGRFRPRSERA
ncbi:MFS transporter [Nonomuraea fastidiosa]|uniref:MFS transporter n=1 Tax=Nonomuraea fastidiosa TaxID=46173 RepID=UPI003673119A